jgi:hypothetical protein
MFNTLKYVKILVEAGVSREQAKNHVQIVSEIMDNHLATQQDLKDLRSELRADMQELRGEFHLLRQEVKNDIALLEQRMTIKLGTIVSIAIGVAVTLAKIVG